MSGDIHASVEAIRKLETACGQFSARVADELPGVEHDLRQIGEELDGRRAELRGEIRRLREEVENADEDENTGGLERRIEEAQEEQARLRRRTQRLEEAASAYTREARKLRELAVDGMVRAQAYLDGAATDLSAYRAASLDAAGGGSAGACGGAAAGTDGIPSVPPDWLSQMPLPEGFTWVPLRGIDPTPDRVGFDGEADFSKGVTREEMVRGFTALQTVILPAVASLGAQNAAVWCASCDVQAGTAVEKSLQRVFDAFFGEEHIYLTRGRDEADLFEITNGRHRIRVAMEMGWPVIPARVSDLRAS